MKKLTTIVAVAVGLATLARADEPVLSVDSNRILSLARQAIAESRQDVEMEAIEFADITYRLDAKQKETLTGSASPSAPKKPAESMMGLTPGTRILPSLHAHQDYSRATHRKVSIKDKAVSIAK